MTRSVRQPEKVNEVQELCDAVYDLFQGHDRVIVGAVLADLLSVWVAGHFVADDKGGETQKFRKQLLQRHMKAVRELVPLSEKQILAGIPKQ
jgi:hypothetical protein